MALHGAPVSAPNILYYGDNLSIMREKMGRLGMVDLIYLDPPAAASASLARNRARSRRTCSRRGSGVGSEMIEPPSRSDSRAPGALPSAAGPDLFRDIVHAAGRLVICG